MRSETKTHRDDEGTSSVAGGNSPVVSLRPRRGDHPVILVFSQRPAARCAADETSPIEGFEHIGEVSVRLVAMWSRPKMTLVQNPRGRGSAPASAHDPWEE